MLFIRSRTLFASSCIPAVHLVLVFGALTLFSLSSKPAFAQTITVVDQSYNAPFDVGAAINSGYRYIAESYTAGLTGTLSGVQVDISSLGGTFPLEITIVGTTSGVPNSTILGQTLLSSAASSFSQVIPFGGTISQVSGSRYAIVADYPTAPAASADDQQGVWHGSNLVSYTRGMAFGGQTFSTMAPASGFYLHFQTLVAIAPEPSPAAALGTGLLCLTALALKARKRKTAL